MTLEQCYEAAGRKFPFVVQDRQYGHIGTVTSERPQGDGLYLGGGTTVFYKFNCGVDFTLLSVQGIPWSGAIATVQGVPLTKVGNSAQTGANGANSHQSGNSVTAGAGAWVPKVGDRVRFRGGKPEVSDVYTVAAVRGDYVDIKLRTGSISTSWGIGHFELAEPSHSAGHQKDLTEPACTCTHLSWGAHPGTDQGPCAWLAWRRG